MRTVNFEKSRAWSRIGPNCCLISAQSERNALDGYYGGADHASCIMRSSHSHLSTLSSCLRNIGPAGFDLYHLPCGIVIWTQD